MNCYGSVPSIDNSKECLSCEALMKRIETTWTNETTVQGILNKLEKDCEHIPDPDVIATCESIAKVLVTIPPSIFAGMESLAWPIPRATCAMASKCIMDCCSADGVPEQIHLSLASNDRSKMGVTWVTLTDSGSIVQYGVTEDNLEFTNNGDTNTYTQAGWKGMIHKAIMLNLKPATTYYYRVGDGEIWSKIHTFTTYNPASTSTTFAVIADMGYGEAGSATVESLMRRVEKNEIDVIIHSGDVGYADGYQRHWDVFFNKIEPMAAHIPYMTTPGNHEFWFNFTAYKERVFMPGSGIGGGVAPPLHHSINIDDSNSRSDGLDQGGSGDSMYYAWEYGKVHFVALNSETPLDTGNFKDDMMDWAASDMKSIDREVTPWLMSHFHRPIYCSNDRACEAKSSGRLRHQVEEVFNDNQVDLVFYGHIHAYERTSEVYHQHKMRPGKAPVYILQGSSGNREGNKGSYPTPDELPDWSQSQHTEVGYGLMTVSDNELHWQFFESGTDVLLDEVTLKK